MELADVLSRIDKRLKAVGLSADAASKMAGKPDAIRNLRRAQSSPDRQGVSTGTLAALAPVLETSLSWLIDGVGEEEPGKRRRVPVMGYIGAGAAIDPDAEQVPPEGLFEVDVPFPIPDDVIAFQIRGDSMLPVRADGDVIVVWRDQRRATEDYVGRVAAVRLVDGGRYYKRILKGLRRGTYTLASFNARDIENARIAWVGEVCVEIPADQVRRINGSSKARRRKLA